MQKFNFEWGEMINLNKYIYIYKQKCVMCFAFFIFAVQVLTVDNPKHAPYVQGLKG